METNFSRTKTLLKGIPLMSVEKAERLREHMLEHRPEHVLELGFAHGVSTCYIASILEDLGRGNVTTIDLPRAKDLDPNIETLLSRTGLGHRVKHYYEPAGYNWRLMRMLESSDGTRFDLCYVDGAHTWSDDGLAFFLVDRLLSPGGWIIFDDLTWTYSGSRSLGDSEWVRDMPDDYKNTPQIRQVFELLVKRHPSYDHFSTERDWAFARKAAKASGEEPRTVTVVKTEEVGLGAAMVRMGKAIAHRLGWI
jgi:predicted O-methyltransferase YrrM